MFPSARSQPDPIRSRSAASEARAVTLTGRGLHTGVDCAVTLEGCSGSVRIACGAHRVARADLELVRTDHGVRVRVAASDTEIELIEHLFAALGGLGIQRDVCITVSGGEVPLCDGGARDFCDALLELELPRSPPALAVAREANYEMGAARYRLLPDDAVAVDVEVEFGRCGPESAGWEGSREDFALRIAPARTFGFVREAGALQAAGRAAYVDPRSVLVLDDWGRCVLPQPGPADSELARHKLLDLVGDLYLYGGPPLGRISARRPGHSNNHAMVARALHDGVLQRMRHPVGS